MSNAIIFPGQGCQTVGMAKEFYDNFRVAREVFDEVDDVLGRGLSKIIFEGPLEELTSTDNAQPAIMAASLAILRTLESESGRKMENLCDFTAGHSLGEYTALCASRSLTLGDTAKLLKVRGETFAEVGKRSQGSMAVLGASVAVVEEILGESTLAGEVLEITNDNTDDQVVISGNEASLAWALEVAKARGISKMKKLSVSGAFHSKLMEPAVGPMAIALGEVSPAEPVARVMANYRAELEARDEIKDNLLDQITSRVRWRETMLNLSGLGVRRFLEIGPGRILTNMVRKTCPSAEASAIGSLEQLEEFLKTLEQK
ncbi:MAG: ACP S-malonyltransferase [Rickettsiales bacterium]|jgi:[acyl-carrier-protein] S-malonyltransferase|nr:ACP S-malonyltransferase [Rickettsiales bacterium]